MNVPNERSVCNFSLLSVFYENKTNLRVCKSLSSASESRQISTKHFMIIFLQFKIFCDRRSVGKSVLASGLHLGPMTRSFIAVGHLLSLCCWAPSLTRGRVWNLLVQFAVTLRSSRSQWPRGLRRFFLFLHSLSETASRPNKRLMRTYHWISLFMSYIQSAN
jgi:hypothetical protein